VRCPTFSLAAAARSPSGSWSPPVRRRSRHLDRERRAPPDPGRPRDWPYRDHLSGQRLHSRVRQPAAHVWSGRGPVRRRRMFIAGATLFASGTLRTTAANPTMLIAGHIIQAADAAALSPAAISLLLLTLPVQLGPEPGASGAPPPGSAEPPASSSAAFSPAPFAGRRSS